MRGRKRHKKKAYLKLVAGKNDRRTRQLAGAWMKTGDPWRRLSRSTELLAAAFSKMGIAAAEAAESIAKAFKPIEAFSGILEKDTKIVAHRGEMVTIEPKGEEWDK